MLITCPYCGPRDVSEFTYQGDANRVRPEAAATDQPAWNEYVYDRLNTLGDHVEFWQHSGGCRSHLKLTRSTLTHAISDISFVRDHGAKKSTARLKPGAGA